MLMAASVLVLTPWGWGGVVLWTVEAALGISVAALVAAVGTLGQQRFAMLVWFVGILLAFLAVPAGHDVWSERWLDYMAFPMAAFAAQSLPAFLYAGDTRSSTASEGLRNLVSSPVLWCGLLFIGYVSVQYFNNWGVVVDRATFWREQGLKVAASDFEIIRVPHLSWLPSGLRAPFVTTDRAFPAMNVWRLLMILGAPWLMFLALRSALRRRRGYVILAWISLLASCAYAAFAFLNQPSHGEIFGFPIPPGSYPFGTFINRNHAAVYFYFNIAAALSVTFWYIRRSGDSTWQGGPHLISGFLALYLGVFATFTNSVGGTLAGAALIGLIAPISYYFGMPRQNIARKEAVFAMVAALLVASLALLFTADFKALTSKAGKKMEAYQRTGADDRRPLRLATWNMATSGGLAGKVWTGWGAGSYRWVSPAFQAEQKEFLWPNGKIRLRATYAHFDWLQALAEVGIIGLLPVLAGLVWLAGWIRRAFMRGLPEAAPLAGVLLIFGLHACVDLLFWFTPLLFMAAFVAAAMIAFVDQSSVTKSDGRW